MASSTAPLAQLSQGQARDGQTSQAPIFDSTAGVDLSDMFGELKHELEEGAANSDADPETHYNLGVAFREMGLLDEAIGELQKVCQSVEHGHPFPQIMQTYTWLAQCFLDKGVPEVAVRWYETALKLPSLDQETRTALHYELGSSFESAGNNPAALSNFMEVYGSNIDYRDVAERIKAPQDVKYRDGFESSRRYFPAALRELAVTADPKTIPLATPLEPQPSTMPTDNFVASSRQIQESTSTTAAGWHIWLWRLRALLFVTLCATSGVLLLILPWTPVSYTHLTLPTICSV